MEKIIVAFTVATAFIIVTIVLLFARRKSPTLDVPAIVSAFGSVVAVIVAILAMPDTSSQTIAHDATATYQISMSPTAEAIAVVATTTRAPVQPSTSTLAPPSATSVPATATSILPAATRVPATTQPAASSTPFPYHNSSETIPPPRTTRHILLTAGELYVGTAVRFAAREYGYTTMESPGAPPYTVFIIKGPIETDIEIENGGWDYWVNVFDDNFAEKLLEPKIEEVEQHGNYATVGHRIARIP